MNNKGFVLLDSLVCVIIVSAVCSLCFSLFSILNIYHDGYLNYVENSNNDIVYYFNNLYECEGCLIDER